MKCPFRKQVETVKHESYINNRHRYPEIVNTREYFLECDEKCPAYSLNTPTKCLRLKEDIKIGQKNEEFIEKG